METHPQYMEIAEHIRRFPAQGPYLFQTYLDLLIGRRWPRIQVVDKDELGKAFLIGQREQDGEIHIVLPMCIDDFVSPSDLASMFQHIPSREFSDDLQTFTPPVFAKPAEVISIPESAVEEPKPAPIVETPGVAGEAKEPENAALAPNEALETPKVEAKLEPATRGRPGKVQAESIVLAVVDHTSTVVYYRIWDGIVPPKV